MNISRSTLLGITLTLAAIFLASFIWHGLYPYTHPGVSYVLRTAVAVMFLWTLLNFGLTIIGRGQRPIHFGLSAAMLALLVGGLASGRMFGDRWQQQFLQHEQAEYVQLVAKLEASQTTLSTNATSPTPLDAIAGRPGVYGRQLGDGHAAYWFNNYPCLSVLHYTGDQLVPQPQNPNAFTFPDAPQPTYLRITNGWYAYMR